MSWDLNRDVFVFKISDTGNKPAHNVVFCQPSTVILILFDINRPQRWVEKFYIEKLYPRDVTDDEPLSDSNVKKWKNCLYSLQFINHFIVPRMVVPISIPFARDVDIHVFIDAKAAVAYLRTMSWESQSVFPLETHCTTCKTLAMRAIHANKAGESTSNHLIIPPDRLLHGQKNGPWIYFKHFPEILHVCNKSRGKDSVEFFSSSEVAG